MHVPHRYLVDHMLINMSLQTNARHFSVLEKTIDELGTVRLRYGNIPVTYNNFKCGENR